MLRPEYDPNECRSCVACTPCMTGAHWGCQPVDCRKNPRASHPCACQVCAQNREVAAS